jgi:DNA-binding transcriptional regulator YiaG
VVCLGAYRSIFTGLFTRFTLYDWTKTASPSQPTGPSESGVKPPHSIGVASLSYLFKKKEQTQFQNPSPQSRHAPPVAHGHYWRLINAKDLIILLLRPRRRRISGYMSKDKKAQGMRNRKSPRQGNLPGPLETVTALETAPVDSGFSKSLPRKDDSKSVSPSPADYERLIGRRLKAYRASRKWPLKRVAFQLSVTEAAVSDWEHGTRFPSGGNLILLSRLFGVSPCQLICAGPEFCPMCIAGHRLTPV